MFKPADARRSTNGKRTRAHDRAPLDGRALIHDESRLYIAPIRNISVGGVFIDFLATVPIGREVKVIIKSSAFPQSLQLAGTVVRVEDGPKLGLAVQFLDVSRDDRALLQNYVHEKLKENGPAALAGKQFRRL